MARAGKRETGSPTNGKGEVTCNINDQIVRDVFPGIIGDIDLMSRRKFYAWTNLWLRPWLLSPGLGVFCTRWRLSTYTGAEDAEQALFNSLGGFFSEVWASCQTPPQHSRQSCLTIESDPSKGCWLHAWRRWTAGLCQLSLWEYQRLKRLSKVKTGIQYGLALGLNVGLTDSQFQTSDPHHRGAQPAFDSCRVNPTALVLLCLRMTAIDQPKPSVIYGALSWSSKVHLIDT
jgi:hypothetical protein